MSKHETPTDCTDSIEFHNEWDVIEAGAYRYGKCTVCGQKVREYYCYNELEAITSSDDENIILYRR